MPPPPVLPSEALQDPGLIATGDPGAGQGLQIGPSSVAEPVSVWVFGIEGVLSNLRGPTPAQPQLIEAQLNPGALLDDDPEVISVFDTEGVLAPVRGWVRPCVKPKQEND